MSDFYTTPIRNVLFAGSGSIKYLASLLGNIIAKFIVNFYNIRLNQPTQLYY